MTAAALPAALASGVLFAVGLGVGGMTRPEKVVAFLDVAGAWDPSLAFVMLGAAGTYAVLYPLIRRRRAPVAAATFAVPERRDVDGRLVVGAALFGLGWGAVGYCPGPAIVALAAGASPTILFVSAMLAGMALHDLALPAASGSAAVRRRPRRTAGSRSTVPCGPERP
jgi:uncharacterized membrane protein YedE/YeeE